MEDLQRTGEKTGNVDFLYPVRDISKRYFKNESKVKTFFRQNLRGFITSRSTFWSLVRGTEIPHAAWCSQKKKILFWRFLNINWIKIPYSRAHKWGQRQAELKWSKEPTLFGERVKKPINIRPQKVKTNLLGQTVKEA